MNKLKPPKTKSKPDRQFDVVVFKMMAALAVSVSLLFGGGTLLVYSVARKLPIEGYSSTVGAVFGIHLAALMVFYAFALFKYIVSD